MAAGLQYTRAELDQRIGGLPRDLNVVFDRIEETDRFLDQFTAEELEAEYGYEAGDGAVIKSAYADLVLLTSIYRGGAALAQAQDFRAFARRLYGLGY